MQEQTGWLDLHARFYDPTLGRFLTIDPQTDSQEHLSPYHYGYDNPIRFSDPEGRCPGCIVGAIIGGAVEYGTQVATNYFQTGKIDANTFTKNINISAIGFAALQGGLTSGASVGRTLLLKGAVLVANNVVEVKTDAKTGKVGVAFEKDASDVIKNTAIDAIADITTGGIKNAASYAAKSGISSIAGSGGSKLADKAKAFLHSRGELNKTVNRNVSQAANKIVNRAANQAGNTTENYIKAKTNPTKDEIKSRTNIN